MVTTNVAVEVLPPSLAVFRGRLRRVGLRPGVGSLLLLVAELGRDLWTQGDSQGHQGTGRDRRGQSGTPGDSQGQDGHKGTGRDSRRDTQRGWTQRRDTKPTPKCLQPWENLSQDSEMALRWLLKLCCTFILLFQHFSSFSVKEEKKKSPIFMDKMQLSSSWQIHAKQLPELELAPLTSQLCAGAQIPALFCWKQMEQ